MGVNINGNEVKKVIFDCMNESNFPKRKDGKNDRVAIVKGLEHGHKYYGTLTVIYADWSEYKTTLMVEKLLEDRKWVQVRDTGDGRFTTFVILFNSMLSGNFKYEVQQQSERYFKQLESMNVEKQKLNDALNEQKTIVNKYSVENSILKADVTLLETRCDKQLAVIEEQKYEIIDLKEQLKTERTKDKISKFDEVTWRTLIKIIGMCYAKGDNVNIILEKVMNFLKK